MDIKKETTKYLKSDHHQSCQAYNKDVIHISGPIPITHTTFSLTIEIPKTWLPFKVQRTRRTAHTSFRKTFPKPIIVKARSNLA